MVWTPGTWAEIELWRLEEERVARDDTMAPKSKADRSESISLGRKILQMGLLITHQQPWSFARFLQSPCRRYIAVPSVDGNLIGNSQSLSFFPSGHVHYFTFDNLRQFAMGVLMVGQLP